MAYLDYKIENSEPIGSGGNANVYLAKNVKTGSMVALKELKTGGRFFEEKKIIIHKLPQEFIKNLQRRNICPYIFLKNVWTLKSIRCHRFSISLSLVE